MLSKGASISRAANALFGNAAVIVPPVRRGLIGYGRFQDNDPDLALVASRVVRNLAPANAGTKLANVNTPTYDGIYMNSDANGGGLETAFGDAEDVTYIATACTAASMSGSDKPILIGNNTSGAGFNMWIDTLASPAPPAGRLRANTYDSVGNNVASVNINNVTLPHMFAFRRTGGNIRVHNLTEALQSSAVAYTPPALVSNNPLRIGRGIQENFTGTAKNLQWAIYRAYLSDAELALIYAFEKAWLAQFSITI